WGGGAGRRAGPGRASQRPAPGRDTSGSHVRRRRADDVRPRGRGGDLRRLAPAAPLPRRAHRDGALPGQRGLARGSRADPSRPADRDGDAVMLANAQCRLAARPVGLPKPSDWDFVEQPAPEPGEGEFRVRVEYLSVDPAMRSWMNAGRSYVPPVEIGEVMRAGGIGRVIDSRHPGYAVGEHVYGVFG